MAHRSFGLVLASLVIAGALAAGALQPAHAVSVTVPITLNMRSGSDTPETAGVAFTVTCAGGGGTHDGNPATQNFTCDDNVTVTVAAPTDAATSRFRFNDYTISKSFTSCPSGTCSTQTYSDVTRQFLTNATLTGLPAGREAGVSLTQVGNATVEPYISPNDYSLQFDGSTQYGQAGNNTIFDITTQGFSWTGKLNRLADSGGTEIFLGKKQSSATAGYRVVIDGADHITAIFRDGTCSDKSASITATSIQIGKWYSWGTSFQRAGDMRIWLYDWSTGTLYTNTADISSCSGSITNTQTFTIARASPGSSNFAAVKLDDTAFFNNISLSTPEFQSVLAGTMPYTPTSFYDFNDGSGSTATDSEGSNNLTLTNSPLWDGKLWSDQGSTYTFNNVSISATERYSSGNAGGTVSAASTPAITYYRQWGHTLTASGISAGVTSVTVTRTQANSGGTEDIAGSTATTIWADNNTTVSVEDPVTISATERWDTAGTVSWSSLTSAQTLTSGTYTQQFKQSVTLSGLDAAQSLDVTRTQLASAGTTSVSGATATDIWADISTSFSIPLVKTITSSQERFQSYNSTAQASYTVTAGNTKTITYQHEFNTLFRVHEEHLGTIFIPMPTAAFTGTVTTSNSTALALTFDTQVTDDHLEPSGGRIWVGNGTTTWSNITWRSLIMNATGSDSITSYGNFDIDSASKHYGYTGNRHFRLGVDQGTINGSATTYNPNTATFEFEATATGTKSAKVEFLTAIYGGVTDIKIDGTSHPSSNWTVNDLGTGVGIVTIDNIPFSTKTITVYFTGGGTGSGSGSGGGGGGGGITVPAIPGSSTFVTPLGLKVFIPPYFVKPGQSQTQNIVVEWSGATALVIQKIEFNGDPSWFQLGVTLPLKSIMAPGEDSFKKEIPLTVALPVDVPNIVKPIDVRVTATTGTASASTTTPLLVNPTGTADFAIYTGVGMVVVIFIAIAWNKLKRRKR